MACTERITLRSLVQDDTGCTRVSTQDSLCHTLTTKKAADSAVNNDSLVYRQLSISTTHADPLRKSISAVMKWDSRDAKQATRLTTSGCPSFACGIPIVYTRLTQSNHQTRIQHQRRKEKRTCLAASPGSPPPCQTQIWALIRPSAYDNMSVIVLLVPKLVRM